jgi:hypothetical protein
MFIWTFVYHGLQKLPLECCHQRNGGHLKFTLPPHGLSLTLITHISSFPATNRMVSSQKIRGSHVLLVQTFPNHVLFEFLINFVIVEYDVKKLSAKF